MQYVLLLFHILLKFTLHLWQVTRSSVGRALYRVSGPSQDGDPVPGNLPFLFFYFYRFLLTLFLESSFLFRVCTKIKNNVKCLRILPSFYFITLAKVFFHLLTSLPFSYFPKLRTVIGMLLLFYSFFNVLLGRFFSFSSLYENQK